MMRSIALSTVVAVTLTACLPACAAVSSDAPSIEEMFAAIEAAKQAKGGQRRPTGSSVASNQPVNQSSDVLSAAIELELKKVRARFVEEYALLQKQGRAWELAHRYVDNERHEEAARLFSRMLTTRRSGDDKNTWRDRCGEFELDYACALMFIGKPKTADLMLKRHEQMLDAALRSVQRPDDKYVQGLGKKQDFVRNYADSTAKLRELEGKLKEGSDAGTFRPVGGDPANIRAGALRELAKLCAPDSYRAVRPLRWLTALLEILEKYPDHRNVANGKMHWELFQAYSHHRLYEDCVRVLELMIERFPKIWQVRGGRCLWEISSSCEKLGDLRRDLRAPRTARPAYEKALTRYEQFKRDYPKDSKCQSSRSGDGSWRPPRVDERIRRVREALSRLPR